MLIFNPEHDLCLANGDVNFVAPESAMKFGVDCGKIADFMRIGKEQFPDKSEHNSCEPISKPESNQIPYTEARATPSLKQNPCTEARQPQASSKSHALKQGITQAPTLSQTIRLSHGGGIMR